MELAHPIVVSLQVLLQQNQSVAPRLLEPSGNVEHARKAMEMREMEAVKAHAKILLINVAQLENAKVAVNDLFLLWQVDYFLYIVLVIER